MTISSDGAAGTHTYRGKTYYFCNPSCLEKFKAQPERYVQGKELKSPTPGTEPLEYTCPMHPEIVRTGPGS